MNSSWLPALTMGIREKASTWWKRTRRAFSRVIQRQRDDHVIYLAGSLAFFTLTALVPMSAVSLSLFSAFISREQEDVFYNYVLEYVFPFGSENRLDAIDKFFTPTKPEAAGESFPSAASPGSIASSTTSAQAAAGIAASVTSTASLPAGEDSTAFAVADAKSLEVMLRNSIRTFIDQARKLKWIGLIFLIFTSIFLFDSIEDAFNSIWRADQRRPFVRRFTTFWTVLTLTPLLTVGPIFLNRYLQSQQFISQDLTWVWNLYSLGQALLPYLLTWFAIWLLYVVVPNGTVSWRPAAISALVVAVLWEVLKPLFAVYAVQGVTNQILYGSLYLVGLVLLWTYYTWWLILMGFEIVAYLHAPDWDQPTPYGELAPEIALLYAWGGLHETGKNFSAGMGGISTEEISRALGLHKIRTIRVLECLEEKQVLARDRRGLWYPARPLDQITWEGVAKALDFEPDSSFIMISDWLESALRARGIQGFIQDTRNLPSLAAVLEHRLDAPVAPLAEEEQAVPGIQSAPEILEIESQETPSIQDPPIA